MAAPEQPSPTVRPVDLRDYARFDPEQATRVRVYTTEALTLDLWCLEPSQATPVLLYGRTAATYTVIGGTAWVVTDEGEIGLQPMGSILVPPGVAHGFDNRTADPLIVLSTAAPPDAADPASEDLPTSADAEAVLPPYDGRRLGERFREVLRRTTGEG